MRSKELSCSKRSLGHYRKISLIKVMQRIHQGNPSRQCFLIEQWKVQFRWDLWINSLQTKIWTSTAKFQNTILTQEKLTGRATWKKNKDRTNTTPEWKAVSKIKRTQLSRRIDLLREWARLRACRNKGRSILKTASNLLNKTNTLCQA